MPMYWYDSGTWKLTQKLYVYDAGTWKDVAQCWIWDGNTSSWQSIYSSTELLTADVCDTFGDPTSGNYTASWTYSSSNIANWIIRIEARFGGGSWTLAADDIDPTNSPYDGSVDGFFGFTTLDTTDFRISLLDSATKTTHAVGSPKIIIAPFGGYLVC